MDTQATLEAFAFTLVQYEAGDMIGYCLAAISLLPFVFLSGLAALILVPRDKSALVIFIGQFANEALNHVLKRLFRGPRPAGRERKDYGMPSSHAQFAFFAAVTVSMVLRYGSECEMCPHKQRQKKPPRWQLWVCFTFAIAALVCYSRLPPVVMFCV